MHPQHVERMHDSASLDGESNGVNNDEKIISGLRLIVRQQGQMLDKMIAEQSKLNKLIADTFGEGGPRDIMQD